MKKLAALILVLILGTSMLFSYGMAMTLSQKQALAMMNYAQYAAYKLKTYNNVAALEDEYRNLKDNMNLEVIEDSESIAIINHLMDAMWNEKKNNANLERLKSTLERKMDDAIYDNVKTIASDLTKGTVIQKVLKTVRNGVSFYSNWQRFRDELTAEYDNEAWNYKVLKEDDLNEIYQELNTYSHKMIHDHDLSDEWRVNENELERMFDCLMDTDPARKYSNLEMLAEDRFFQHFPMFWYLIGQSAFENGDDGNALKYWTRFEQENVPVFRYDNTAVDAYKGKITIMLGNKRRYSREILQKLSFIEKNRTSWKDWYFCALAYANMGKKDKAAELLEKNINELSALVDARLLEGSSILKIWSSQRDWDRMTGTDSGLYGTKDYDRLLEEPCDPNYDGLELCRNLLMSLGKKDAVIDSVKAQYAKDTAGYSESLYVMGRTPTDQVVANSIADISRIEVSVKSSYEHYVTVTCRLPLQWMMSSGTMLLAGFESEENGNAIIPLHIDEKAMKRETERSIETGCSLVYTTGLAEFDWRKEGMRFTKLIIHHPLYPLVLEYSPRMGIEVRNMTPDSIIFNEKRYSFTGEVAEDDRGLIDSLRDKVSDGVDAGKGFFGGLRDKLSDSPQKDEESSVTRIGK